MLKHRVFLLSFLSFLGGVLSVTGALLGLDYIRPGYGIAGSGIVLLACSGYFVKRLTYDRVSNVVSTSIKSRSFFVDLLLPVAIAKDIQANLEEALPLWIAAHGLRRANWIKRSQEIQLIVGHWFSPVKLAFETVVRLIK